MNTNWLQFLPGFVRRQLENRYGLQAIISNTGWLLADKVLRMGVGLAVGVWIARYLGPEQYGLWNFTIAFAALFGAIATQGLDSIVVRELVRTPERRDVILGSAFALKLTGAGVALVCALSAILLLRPGEALTLWLVALSAAGFIFQSVTVIDFYFQASLKARYAVSATNAAYLLMAFVKIGLLLSSAPLIAFAWAGLAEVALGAAFLLVAYRANHFNALHWQYDRRVMLHLLQNSWPLFLASMAVMIYMRVDVVMLQQMVGGREVGVYTAATKLSELWYFLPSIIVASVSPALIRAHGSDADLYNRRLRKLYFFMGWLAVGVSLPLALLSGWIVDTLYGSEYARAAPVLAIHMWASVAVFLGVASSQHLLVTQLQKISLYRTLIGLLCNILLNLLLIPRLGAMGAAIATVISYFAATFSLVLFKSTRAHARHLLLALFARY